MDPGEVHLSKNSMVHNQCKRNQTRATSNLSEIGGTKSIRVKSVRAKSTKRNQKDEICLAKSTKRNRLGKMKPEQNPSIVFGSE